MKSTMQHSFSHVPSVQIPRSSFDRSHGHKTTLNLAGELYPVFVDEALPGDTFNMQTFSLVRMNNPIAPIMDNLYLDIHYFSVPLRQLWDNARKFFGERVNPDDSIDYTVPVVQATSHPVGNFGEETIYDFMGVPPGVAAIEPSALFFRAYNHIWNEWYRDQNLQDSVAVATDDGPDTESDYSLLRRGKRHDYFTSALPWPQKADAGVSIPLGTEAPVIGIGTSNNTYTSGSQAVRESNEAADTYFNYQVLDDGDSDWFVEQNQNTAGYPGIRADLSAATAATINQLREAFQVQRLLERDARGGTRYNELIRSHFGVINPDVTYRPEFLGGGSTKVNINPVYQTASTQYPDVDQNGGLGEVGAFGIASFNGQGFTKSFTEHCIILGIASVRADQTYQYGLERMFNRQTRYDFYWPSLAFLGEQEIKNVEIYAQGTSADDDVFGYQERYAEYRYKPSRVSGQMRTTNSQSLDIWHLAPEFTSLPTLGDTFIQENPPLTRTMVVPLNNPHFVADFYFNLRCARPMPLFGVPGMLDHF